MDLLERYLQAVGQFLPAATRMDIVEELRANLQEQMDARAEELGRPLREAETADVLREHGRPEEVATRYLPQRSLIGPGLFPIYELTLRKGVGYVALVYAIVRGIALAVAPSTRGLSEEIVEAVLGLAPTLLYFWGIVTIVFAAIEFAQSRYGVVVKAKAWDPAKLPPVGTEDGAVKRRSRASRVAELVMHCLWATYVLLLPSHPFLLLGPGGAYLRSAGVQFAPVWHVFYMFVVAVLLLQLLGAVLALTPGRHGWGRALSTLKQLLNIGAFSLMVYAGEYFLPATAAANAGRIVAANAMFGIGFRVALFFAVVGLVIEGWKWLRRSVSTGPMAMGAPR